MTPLLGMAGLAEAGMAADLMLSYCVLLLILVTTILSLIFRSWWASLTSITLAALMGMMCLPWDWLNPVETNDPDFQGFLASYRSLIWYWVATAIFALLSFVLVFWKLGRVQDAPKDSGKTK